MSKFTPRPWTIEYFDEYDEELLVGPDWNVIEGHGNGEYGIKFNNPSDMKLVSKAPEMFQLITNMRSLLITLYDEEKDFAKLIEDYIEKAQNLLKEIDGD